MDFIPLAERLTRRVLTSRGVRSRWIDTSLARLHVYDAPGDGPLPPIVVLHGMSSSAAPFAPLVQRLRRRARRVLAPEAPGHGFSDPPSSPLTPERLFAAMTEVFERELDEPAILFGNSLGGGVALSYAMHRPDKVLGLALASPAGARMEERELRELISAFRMRSSADARSFMERLYRRPPWFAPLLAGELVRHMARDVIVSFTDSVSAADGFSPEQLSALSMPILLLWGRADRIMPASNLEFFRTHLPPHTRIEEPEEVGHCPHLDDPRLLADRLAAFAEEVARAGRKVT